MKQIKVLDQENLGKSIGVVVGTRPGIIKFSPVIRALQNSGADFFVIHTGQHYSHNMDRTFFDELELVQPRFTNDQVREYSTHGGQTAEMIKGVEKACLEAKPSVVIVGGDANTNFAAAVAVRKLVTIKLVHMEAGLRSYDWRMPEEHNRVMIDHISDVLLLPTENVRKHLVEEGVRGKVHYTGNTIVDAVEQNLELARRKSKILEQLGDKPYLLLTAHREENVDNKENLEGILEGMKEVGRQNDYQIVFPVHPRTRKRFAEFGVSDLVDSIPGIRLLEPVGYLDFLILMSHAQCILTDSGGIQEEACILKVPCVTLRENTERPETMEVGSNVIAGTDPKRIVDGFKQMMAAGKDWKNPFGDGKTGQRIADILIELAEG